MFVCFNILPQAAIISQQAVLFSDLLLNLLVVATNLLCILDAIFCSCKTCRLQCSQIMLLAVFFFSILRSIGSVNVKEPPIVFVHNALDTCSTVPTHVQLSIQQAAVVRSPNTEIYLLSRCMDFGNLVDIPRFVTVNCNSIASLKTDEFVDANSKSFYFKRTSWRTTITRFFFLEDFMISHGYSEALLADTNQMLYGHFMTENATTPFPKSLIMSGLSAHTISTALAWVGNVAELSRYTHYYSLMLNDDGEMRFSLFSWLSLNPLCRSFVMTKAINDRTFSSWYFYTFPGHLLLFPTLMPFEEKYKVLPMHHMMTAHEHDDSVSDRQLARSPPPPWRDYAQGGRLVVPEDQLPVMKANTDMLVDPGSWGLLYGSGLDAVESSNSLILPDIYNTKISLREKKQGDITLSDVDVKVKTDASHFAGMVMAEQRCEVKMMCSAALRDDSTSTFFRCLTAPFVRCGDSNTPIVWHMLWNLKVRNVVRLAELQDSYISRPCRCDTSP